MSEPQRGPDISVTYQVWERIEWKGGQVTDWQCSKLRTWETPYTTLESAQARLAELPAVIPDCLIGRGGRVSYRIRQAITILEWLE